VVAIRPRVLSDVARGTAELESSPSSPVAGPPKRCGMGRSTVPQQPYGSSAEVEGGDGRAGERPEQFQGFRPFLVSSERGELDSDAPRPSMP
jgi:hypothetical protein